ncbi:hypothetical protein BU52_06080 [Streptomyces toyocaensis]|uniref:Type A2 lantipeptide n=1 Tax=Streptomyces toyocaensis TaxID=55952 RepID=A0A081XWS2_STRTO|nr:hypothetical protein [Streptomyces toyocaensis]KES07995.1 hypothetical protein BU52_06080 [Streptomyces toyocaensis]
MNFVPQVATAEISDADLDQVSGGLAGGVEAGLAVPASAGAAGAGLHVEAGPLSLCAGLGASVTPGAAAVNGHAHTTMV